MMDLHKYFTNPFNNPNYGMDKLVAFGTDHLARLIANNPAAIFAARILATTAALAGVGSAFTDDKTKMALRVARKQAKDAFRNALPVAVGKIYGAVESQFGDNGPQLTECFPQGRTVFSSCTDGALAEELQTLINGVTDYQTQLGAPVVASATALLTNWNAVYQTSETSTGNKATTQAAKKAARAALQLELFKNLLTLALNFPDQPDELDVYMQQSLLTPHTPTPPTPPPAALVVARDANGTWTFVNGDPTLIYVQEWVRSSSGTAWSNAGDMRTSHFPAPDADIVPGNVTWWQVKFCGEDGDGNQSTPFSNVISFGPVPA
jgi:hypothetical protein